MRLRHQIDVEVGTGPDLEILTEKHGLGIDADLALTRMDRIARIGLDERAFGDELAGLLPAQHLHPRRRGKDVGEEEDAEGKAEGEPDETADEEPLEPPPHVVSRLPKPEGA